MSLGTSTAHQKNDYIYIIYAPIRYISEQKAPFKLSFHFRWTTNSNQESINYNPFGLGEQDKCSDDWGHSASAVGGEIV